jgi:hypothetical protein
VYPVVAGTIVGLLPAWLDWLAGHGPPSANALPACTTDVPARAALTFGSILPYLWGLPLAAELPDLTGRQWLLALPAAAFAAAAICLFGWRQRRPVARLLALAPLGEAERPVASLAILFAVPVGLILLSGNATDHLALRYLGVTWQAGSVLFALFVVLLARRSRVAAAAIFALYVWQAGISGLRHEAISTRDLDPAGLYRDYVLAYQLDVLARERVIFAPYNGISRYAAYESPASAARRRAIVIPAAWGKASLQELLEEGTVSGPTRSDVLDLVRRGAVEERLRVGDWDIWLVR